jgi:hypothetical protein
MRESRRRNASRMAPSDARAEDLMARRRAGSTAGAVVEVARSMSDAMEESAAAAKEEEGFEPSSGSADAAADAVWRPAKEEETVGRGMAAIRGDRRKGDPFVRRWVRLVGGGEAVMLDRISALDCRPQPNPFCLSVHLRLSTLPTPSLRICFFFRRNFNFVLTS